MAPVSVLADRGLETPTFPGSDNQPRPVDDTRRAAVAFRLLTAITCAVLMVSGAGASAAQRAAPDRDEIQTARLLDSIRDRPARLRAFLAAMPKGGDLHNHLSGAVPTETLIRFAVEDRLCIDTATLTATPAPATRPPGLLDPLLPPAPPTCAAGQRPASDSSTDPDFFEQILRAWSMHGFVPGVESGHDHFFATFGKFGLATERKGDMLAAVATINAEQNVAYLETLASRQGNAVRALATKVGFDPDFDAMRNKLLANGLAQIVSAASAETDADLARFAELLGCRTPHPQPACRLVVRYVYQVGRAVDPEIVFTNLLLGFELQRTDSRYVGVNLVQPEDNAVALRDYTLQMRMIAYLRSVYPRGHVTLHAGELVPGLVEPADLTFSYSPGRRDRGRRADRARRQPCERDGLSAAASDDGASACARRNAADEQRADSRRIRRRPPVRALPGGPRARCAGHRRPCCVADRHHARIRDGGHPVPPALPSTQRPRARIARARVPARQQPLAYARRL